MPRIEHFRIRCIVYFIAKVDYSRKSRLTDILRYPIDFYETLTLGHRLSTTTLTELSYLETLVSTVYQGTLIETSYITGPTVTRNTPETVEVTLSPATE